jgi:hypothetical protein
LEDRFRSEGRVVRAVAGFDATFSAPKSLSVVWALTGDDRLLEAHDVAVTAALEHVERFGSTTRVRVKGGRQFVDTDGLTIAAFCQTTSRADDPQIHAHAVISARRSTWTRAEVMRNISNPVPPVSQMSGHRWEWDFRPYRWCSGSAILRLRGDGFPRSEGGSDEACRR